ncbi:MAG: adenosylhomocysteinase, partial [Candidatus Limnocylindria bacterium]
IEIEADDGATRIAARPKALADTAVRDRPVAAGTSSPAPQHDVADLGLADAGQAKIEWADAQMPVLASIKARFEKEKPLEGIT